MPLLPHKLEQDRAEDLLLALAELRDHPGHKALLLVLQTRLQNTQRELESAIPLRQLRQLQGKVSALKEALRALDDLEKELKTQLEA